MGGCDGLGLQPRRVRGCAGAVAAVYANEVSSQQTHGGETPSFPSVCPQPLLCDTFTTAAALTPAAVPRLDQFTSAVPTPCGVSPRPSGGSHRPSKGLLKAPAPQSKADRSIPGACLCHFQGQSDHCQWHVGSESSSTCKDKSGLLRPQCLNTSPSVSPLCLCSCCSLWIILHSWSSPPVVTPWQSQSHTPARRRVPWLLVLPASKCC